MKRRGHRTIHLPFNCTIECFNSLYKMRTSIYEYLTLERLTDQLEIHNIE